MAFGKERLSKPVKKELIPSGVHIARCYSVVSLGTQEIEWQGVKKLQEKVMLTFELPNKKKVFDEEKGEQPMVIGKKYTISTHEKSNIVKDFKVWFSDEKPDGDICSWLAKECVGKPAMITIAHDSFEKDGDSIEFQFIAGVAPLMDGIECPEQINDSILYDIDNHTEESFAKVPEWQQDIIKKSPDFIKNEKLPTDNTGFKEEKPVATEKYGTKNETTEDLPF